MYKIALLALLCAFSSLSQGALASPLEGGGVMLMAKRNMMGGAKWKNPYQTADNALVAMWDGIENAGFGIHDESATSWKQLLSNTSDYDLNTPTEKVSFTKDSLVAIIGSPELTTKSRRHYSGFLEAVVSTPSFGLR